MQGIFGKTTTLMIRVKTELAKSNLRFGNDVLSQEKKEELLKLREKIIIYNRFEQLFFQTKYKEAAYFAAEPAHQEILRTRDTIEKFRSVQAGKFPPLLQYFAALLIKGKLDEYESLELSSLILKRDKKTSTSLLEKWLAEDKLECSEKLGDLVKTVDNDLAHTIYTRAGIIPKVDNALAERKEVDKIPKQILTPSCDPNEINRKVAPPQHQVFINFRGELRNNFISHLVDALRRNEINIYIDYQELRGEDISILLKRIEESRIALAVFSRNYTGSKWCLREAAKIKDCVEQGILQVIPIFYKVSTTDVKQLKGEFGDNFRDRENESRFDKQRIERVERWKEALAFISGKFGLTFDDKSGISESDFIGTIIEGVLRLLATIPSTAHSVNS